MSDYIERHQRLYSALIRGQGSVRDLSREYPRPKYNSFVSFMDYNFSTKGLQRSFVISEANMNPQYGYKILNGTKHTQNPNVILRLCIAMKLSLDEVQNALRLYRMCPLDKDIIREDIIILGIENSKTVFEIDEWLLQNGEKPLIDDCT